MIGYEELQDAYEENHRLTSERRILVRDSLNMFRQAMIRRLGLSDDKGLETVILKGHAADDLFAQLASLENGQSLHFMVDIVVGGRPGLPKTVISTNGEVFVGEEGVYIRLSDIDPVRLSSPTDYHNLANSLFEKALKRLASNK